MIDIFKKILNWGCFKKIESFPVFLILLYAVFSFAKDGIWTFFLFLNDKSFEKYILNYDGLIKLFQQLKNDNVIYLSFYEVITFSIPIISIIVIVFYLIRYFNNWLSKTKNSRNILINSAFRYSKQYVVYLNSILIFYFLADFALYCQKQYNNSVNEYVQNKIWMTEYNREVKSGCSYYPIKSKTNYYHIDILDFILHFSNILKSPLAESLKDVLAVKTTTAIEFDKRLCDYSNIDQNKFYTGKEVMSLLNSYAEQCKKKPMSEFGFSNVSNNENLKIRIARNGFNSVIYLNNKLISNVDFLCSSNSDDIQIYKTTKLLNGE